MPSQLLAAGRLLEQVRLTLRGIASLCELAEWLAALVTQRAMALTMPYGGRGSCVRHQGRTAAAAHSVRLRIQCRQLERGAACKHHMHGQLVASRCIATDDNEDGFAARINGTGRD